MFGATFLIMPHIPQPPEFLRPRLSSYKRETPQRDFHDKASYCIKVNTLVTWCVVMFTLLVIFFNSIEKVC